MSAETLRRAASLMRERAEAATQGPWLLDSIENGEHGLFLPDGRGPEHERLGCGGSQIAGWMTDFNATHIASWDPAVALAVATWLDSHADIHALRTCDERLIVPCPALAVARAYLGGAA